MNDPFFFLPAILPTRTADSYFGNTQHQAVCGGGVHRPLQRSRGERSTHLQVLSETSDRKRQGTQAAGAHLELVGDHAGPWGGGGQHPLLRLQGQFGFRVQTLQSQQRDPNHRQR